MDFNLKILNYLIILILFFINDTKQCQCGIKTTQQQTQDLIFQQRTIDSFKPYKLLQRRKRIVNGRLAEQNEWCWQVALFSREGIIGSGTLVGDRHIITAAHVVENLDREEFLILIGMMNVFNSPVVITLY